MIGKEKNLVELFMKLVLMGSNLTPEILGQAEMNAIVVFPGGENDEEDGKKRILTGFNLFEEGVGKLLLVAGDSTERTEKFGRTDSFIAQKASIIIGENMGGANTLTQADWTAKQVEDRNIQSLILITAFYHLPRALMTLLKSLSLIKQQGVRIIPYPVLVPKCWHKIIEEIEKIIRYQEFGNVSETEDVIEYLKKYFIDV